MLQKHTGGGGLVKEIYLRLETINMRIRKLKKRYTL